LLRRKLRVQYPGAIYRLINRGDRREDLFESNHFHLVVETPEPNLVAGMKWLLGTYASRFNRRHQEFGHVFSGRFLGDEGFKEELLGQMHQPRGGRYGAELREAGAAQAERVVAKGESRKQKAESRNRTGDNETGGGGLRRRGWREAELTLPPSLGASASAKASAFAKAMADKPADKPADTSAQGRPREGGDGLALAPRNHDDLEMDRETA
jgi:hypothetical protein